MTLAPLKNHRRYHLSKYSALARNTTFRFGTTSGRSRSSRKDWWFAARRAGPSVGMFSRPITLGRYSRRSSGPRNTFFISHQNTGFTFLGSVPPLGSAYPNTPYGAARGRKRSGVLAFGQLERTLLAILVLLVGARRPFARSRA